MLVHVVGPVAHWALQTLVPDTTDLHWNLLHKNVVYIPLRLDFLLKISKISERFSLGSSVSTQYYCGDLQSKKSACSPRHCSSAGGQEAHSKRQGPSGLHSQNRLQSATQHMLTPEQHDYLLELSQKFREFRPFNRTFFLSKTPTSALTLRNLLIY